MATTREDRQRTVTKLIRQERIGKGLVWLRMATQRHRVEGPRKAKAWLGDVWDRMQGKGLAMARAAMARMGNDVQRCAAMCSDVQRNGKELRCLARTRNAMALHGPGW